MEPLKEGEQLILGNETWMSDGIHFTATVVDRDGKFVRYEYEFVPWSETGGLI